jgi:hypothetical protein
MEQPLCAILLAKIQEQTDKTHHLCGLVPADMLDWKPDMAEAFAVGQLMGHLLECLAGFCAVLARVDPQRLAHFQELRGLPVNHRCQPAEARERISVYGERIREGFALLKDSDLSRPVTTVFVSAGESFLTLLLGNLEHLVNHKYQLYAYLKLMGVKVGSRDLYQFRGE